MTKGKFLFYCALSAAALYSGGVFYPAVFFSSKYVYKNLTLYTHAPIGGSSEKLLPAIYDKLAADDFYDAADNFEIYLAGNYKEYAFLAPFCRKDRSCAHPVTYKVFIASPDLGKNLAYGPSGGGIGRDLASVITHELVKVQIKNKMGALNNFFVSDWRKEGYAEHIAMETRDLNPSDFCAGGTGSDPALPYLENRLIVEMLKAEDEIDYTALMKANYSYESVRSRVKRRYCNNK
jgi:hypothetical protein